MKVSSPYLDIKLKDYQIEFLKKKGFEEIEEYIRPHKKLFKLMTKDLEELFNFNKENEEKGIIIWMVIVILIGIPLSTAFSRMKEDSRIQKSLSNFSFMLGDHEVKLKNIAVVHQYKTTEIHSEVISSGILTAKEKRVLKKVVLGKIGKYAQVVVVFKYLL